MKIPISHLLYTRRFWPLFVTQFLGAFNDNLFKTGIVMLITYNLYSHDSKGAAILTNIVLALFILPFTLLSALAGEIAEKYEKPVLVRLIKVTEVVIVTLGALGLVGQNLYLMLITIFLMGIHSSFFGPLKYSLLPEQLETKDLIEANALFEGGTFIAILLGTIIAGSVIVHDSGILAVSALVISVSIIGLIASLFIPNSPATTPELRLSKNPITATLRLISSAKNDRVIKLAIIGISWFWTVGAIFLSQFPSFAVKVLNANDQVSTLFLALFSIGIGVGSYLCHKILKGEISPRLVPLGAFGISVFTTDLILASSNIVPLDQEINRTIPMLLSSFSGIRISLDIFLTSLSGAFYIVPLYALIQSRSSAGNRAQNIAANNVVNAIFMVVGSLVAVILYKLGSDVLGVFATLAFTNILATLLILKILPHEIVKSCIRTLATFFFRVEVRGMDNYRNAGSKGVVIVNHLSFLDAPLLGAFLPDIPIFAVNSLIARRWWVKPAKFIFDLFPIDAKSPLAIKHLIHEVNKGKKCVIFPEGRISVTGSLMKIHEGPALIATATGAPLIPIRIEGAQFSFFSKLKGKVNRRLFPKITITILPAQSLVLPNDVGRRTRRRLAGSALYNLMTELIFQSSNRHETLYSSLCRAQKLHGGNFLVAMDPAWQPLSYNKLIAASQALGAKIAKFTTQGEHVGFLLPNSSGALITFFALHAYSRVPAMLNFSSGADPIKYCCDLAQIRTIITSQQFIKHAKLDSLIHELEKIVKVIYLEELSSNLTWAHKIFYLLCVPLVVQQNLRRAIDEEKAKEKAVLLFTSGSEGKPKGVVLSHENIQANRFQVAARIDFNSSDKVFNALPMFHSFGLTIGTLLPVLSGMKTFLYPSPLHYRVIPELVYESDSTILFGTDTFLRGYGSAAHPYDFHHTRLVFAGAEPLRSSTRAMWAEKFGIRILEGYGATETAPVLSMLTPMHYKLGSVGRLLPQIEYRIEPVSGVEEDGRLFVRGPNVMAGYLRSDQHLDTPHEGWYDTGDIVNIDSDGFLYIRGRAKRFAKVGGEMVSLLRIEEVIAAEWPSKQHAVIAIDDERKGEQLILFSEDPNLDKNVVAKVLRAKGITELAFPRRVININVMPILGSGKINYQELSQHLTRGTS